MNANKEPAQIHTGNGLYTIPSLRISSSKLGHGFLDPLSILLNRSFSELCGERERERERQRGSYQSLNVHPQTAATFDGQAFMAGVNGSSGDIEKRRRPEEKAMAFVGSYRRKRKEREKRTLRGGF